MKQHLEVSLLVSFLEPKIDITLVLAEQGVRSERFLSLPDVLVTTHHSGQWPQLIRYMIFEYLQETFVLIFMTSEVALALIVFQSEQTGGTTFMHSFLCLLGSPPLSDIFVLIKVSLMFFGSLTMVLQCL